MRKKVGSMTGLNISFTFDDGQHVNIKGEYVTELDYMDLTYTDEKGQELSITEDRAKECMLMFRMLRDSFRPAANGQDTNFSLLDTNEYRKKFGF